MSILKTTDLNNLSGLVAEYVNYIFVKQFLKNILALKLGSAPGLDISQRLLEVGQSGIASVPRGAAVFSPRSEVTAQKAGSGPAWPVRRLSGLGHHIPSISSLNRDPTTCPTN